MFPALPRLPQLPQALPVEVSPSAALWWALLALILLNLALGLLSLGLLAALAGHLRRAAEALGRAGPASPPGAQSFQLFYLPSVRSLDGRRPDAPPGDGDEDLDEEEDEDDDDDAAGMDEDFRGGRL